MGPIRDKEERGRKEEERKKWKGEEKKKGSRGRKGPKGHGENWDAKNKRPRRRGVKKEKTKIEEEKNGSINLEVPCVESKNKG